MRNALSVREQGEHFRRRRGTQIVSILAEKSGLR